MNVILSEQWRNGVSMKSLIHNIRIKLGLYNLRKEGAKWVAKNMGEEICRGIFSKV